MASARTMDLTKGSVFKKLVVFAIPIFLSGLLQQLYHSADVVVVGNFARDSKTALAAVGSTGAITNLILNLFLGLSVGANVVCANLYGAREKEKLDLAMHTSILIAVISGVFVGLVGVVFAKPLLLLMGSPETVIDQAALYMKIIFLGQPGALVYNFGAAILRSFGDTKRPMYILTFSGIINVVLNVVFVAAFHWDAAGVAVATIIANYVSAVLILYILFHPQGEQKMSVSRLKFDLEQFKRLVKIGVPSGLNGMLYSASNVVIMSAINSFGDVFVAANSASANIEAIIYQGLAATFTACTSFSGQNYGAKNLKRIDKLFVAGNLLCGAVSGIMILGIALFPSFFLGLFTSDAEVIQTGIPRLMLVGIGYLLYIPAEISVGCTRGMGKSVSPMFLNIFCVVVCRIFWILFVFPVYNTYFVLLLCYPLSWLLVSTSQTILYFYYRKKEAKRFQALALSEGIEVIV